MVLAMYLLHLKIHRHYYVENNPQQYTVSRLLRSKIKTLWKVVISNDLPDPPTALKHEDTYKTINIGDFILLRFVQRIACLQLL